MNKILAIGIVSMLLLTSFTVVSAVRTDIENEESATNRLTNNQLSQIYTFIENHVDMDLNPLLKQILQDSLTLTDSGDPPDLPDIPIFREFSSCDDIYIDGTGLWNTSKTETEDGEDVLMWTLDEGEAIINGESFVYKPDEIIGFGGFFSFDGFLEPEESQELDAEFGDIIIDGSAGYGLIIEMSLLVFFHPEKERNKIGKPILFNIKQWNFDPPTGDDLTLDNPHFYLLDLDNPKTVYAEQVEDTWILKPDEKIKWSWTQKLPRGNYLGAAEFLINDRAHPTIFDSIIKVRHIADGNKAINTPFLNFLEDHPILFQLLQRFLKL